MTTPRWARVTGWSLAAILLIVVVLVADAYFLFIARHSSTAAAWAVSVVGGLILIGGVAALVVRDRSLAAVPVIVGIVGVLIGLGVYIPYRHLWGQITVKPIERVNKEPAHLVKNAENFLLMGSDLRGKGDARFGEHSGCNCSDTTILVHISAGARSATMISIPRDSWVQIPSCKLPDGQDSTPQMSKFNAAYSIGGPSCTVSTVEQLTHVPIDHYAVIDFNGFVNVVKALGGVQMCVAKPLDDPVQFVNGHWQGSGLNLPAGKHVEINGFQALALMRARYNLDGGGDLPRIKRQQQFIGAVIRKAFSTGLLVDLPKLYSVIDAATKSLTTDGFGISQMKKLADAVHDVGPGGVRLLTVPTVSDVAGLPYGDVEWDPTLAPALWQAIRYDHAIPGTKPSASPSPSTSPTPSGPKLTVPPSGISVAVQNGTGEAGLAHKVAGQLTSLGFHVVSVGDAATTDHATTLVEYGSTKVQSSQTVAAAIPGAVRQADSTAGSTITVIVGRNFTKTQPVTISGGATPTPTTTPSIPSTSASHEGCLQ